MQLYQPSTTSTVSFSSSFGKSFKLIEVPEDVLKLVESGEDLSIVGNDSDAVVCTSDKTYSIKRVEYSNSVYFVPPADNNAFSIESSCTDYYEIKPIPGRLDHIDSLLNETEYKGAALDGELQLESGKLVRRSDIAKVVQASSAEVNNYLSRLGVVEIDGFVRLLSKSAIQETIQQLFILLLSERWQINHVDEAAALRLLPECDKIIIRHVLQQLGKKIDAEYWELSLDEIMKASAHLIFNKSLDKKILCSTFLHDWFQQTPGVSNESCLNEKLLKGIAIKEESTKSTNSTYRYCPLSDLPRDPKLRFKQLFDVKSKFLLEELEPYTPDLYGKVGQPKSMAEVLLQYTTCINGVYVSK